MSRLSYVQKAESNKHWVAHLGVDLPNNHPVSVGQRAMTGRLDTHLMMRAKRKERRPCANVHKQCSLNIEAEIDREYTSARFVGSAVSRRSPRPAATR